MSETQETSGPGSPSWIARHRAVVSASQIPILFGLPVYGGRTAADLWYEKKFGTVGDSVGNESTSLGTRLEPLILAMAEERFGGIIDRQAWYTEGMIGATLDGRVATEGHVIEAKTSGIVGPSKLAEWGDDDSDECPDQYLLQVQAQLLVTGAELGHIAALIGGRGFATFTITPHAGLFAAMRAKAADFMASVAGDVAPHEPPQLETLRRLRRQPAKVLPRSDAIEEARDRYESAKSANKATGDEKDAAQAALLALLGDAEAVEVSGGLLTYYTQTNRYPARLASETSFRVLRFKKGG